MSDTPKTDAACGWPWGHHGRIESSDLLINVDGPFVHAAIARELERENAELRKDKERLDWIAKNRSVSVTERPLAVTPDSLRVAIDAYRKEAQP